MKLPFTTLLLLAASSLALRAQAPGVPIEEPGDQNGSAEMIAKASALREDGKLVDAARIKELIEKPVPEKIALPPAKSIPLSREGIYEFSRQCRVRVGWYFLCHKCNHWHTRLAGGYPLTEDGVIATCHHVAKPEDDMREGYLIVVDAGGNVTPVTSIIADNAELDICLLRASGGKFNAMALNDAVRPGDAAYCLSDPLGINGYFSEGMVNRFFRRPEGKGTPEERLRLHVSTDWAPGSSGSPVLDECGNVIGHVSTISAMSDPRNQAAGSPEQPRRGDTQMVLHEASPARGVLQMIRNAAENLEHATAEPVASSEPPAEPAREPEIPAVPTQEVPNESKNP